jgi:hypothetical protein
MIKKLIKNIIGLSFAVAVFFTLLHYLFYPIKTDKNSYLAATIDKEKLLDSISSPRVIFVGGSSLAFGIDSKCISHSLGLPVVNMGLHAGLGLDFILNEAKSGLKSGDIIVLSTEYYLKKAGHPKVKAQLLEANPTAIKHILSSPFDYIRLNSLYMQRYLKLSFNSFRGSKKESIHPVYSRSAFNSFGDNIAHLKSTGKPHFDLVNSYPKRYDEEINDLNNFIDYANSRGSKVFYLFPNCPQQVYDMQKAAILRFERDMKSGLKCPILNNTQSQLFPDSLCFDTMYHLNKHGRDLKTKIIIQTLHPVSKNLNFNKKNAQRPRLNI